ncbi:MAG: lipopolysaccharide kinase InaA family protein [Candidatus Bathyarchaeia archaeon]
MSSGRRRPSMELDEQILGFCRQIAGSGRISGACICGDAATFIEKTKLMEVLLVIDGFKPKLMNYVKFFDGKPAIFYAVDRWVFERDVDSGFLGEALGVHLIFPYKPLVGEKYLKTEEVGLKKRLILEILENLVLDFPELSYEIRIKPEYFMYEAMLSRARLFPPLYYAIHSFLQTETFRGNVERVMQGYMEALKELRAEGILENLGDGFFKISKDFIENLRSRKIFFKNILRSTQKTLFMTLLGTFPKILRVMSENVAVLSKLQFFEGEKWRLEVQREIGDSKAYLFVPTASGLTSLAAKMGIEDFAKKVLNLTGDVSVEVEELGGVLNDVFLVRAVLDCGERKVVVKSFKDWSGFKWFPLTLWTFGTRTFAVLGRSRLERECSINQFLHSKGFAVPRLLGVSHAERLVFMEYLDGESLEKVVKRAFELAVKGNNIQEELEILRKVGEILARVHAFEVALGDTKPENILVGRDGNIYLMDFEQASHGGDKAWDIAELLYFIGHYAPPLASVQVLKAFVKAFLRGYLEAGGDLEAVKAAGKPKYTKVFSLFVFPHVILAISNICRKAEQLRELENG